MKCKHCKLELDDTTQEEEIEKAIDEGEEVCPICVTPFPDEEDKKYNDIEGDTFGFSDIFDNEDPDHREPSSDSDFGEVLSPSGGIFD